MTIEVLSVTAYAIKRSVARHDGYDPRDTHAWLSGPARPGIRSEYAANRQLQQRAMADYAVYRKGRD